MFILVLMGYLPKFLASCKEVHIRPGFRRNKCVISESGCTFLVITVIVLNLLIGDLINCFIRLML